MKLYLHPTVGGFRELKLSQEPVRSVLPSLAMLPALRILPLFLHHDWLLHAVGRPFLLDTLDTLDTLVAFGAKAASFLNERPSCQVVVSVKRLLVAQST